MRGTFFLYCHAPVTQNAKEVVEMEVSDQHPRHAYTCPALIACSERVRRGSAKRHTERRIICMSNVNENSNECSNINEYRNVCHSEYTY